jgi:hypothetical protein
MYCPLNVFNPKGKVNIYVSDIITNDIKKLFHDPKKINIACAAKAGLAKGKTIGKKGSK